MFKSAIFAFLALSASTAFAASPKCARVACPQNMIHCPDGTERVDIREKGECCPKWDCQETGEEKPVRDCTHTRCPRFMPHCNRDEKMVDKRKEGTCCPMWHCEKKPKGHSDDAGTTPDDEAEGDEDL